MESQRANQILELKKLHINWFCLQSQSNQAGDSLNGAQAISPRKCLYLGFKMVKKKKKVNLKFQYANKILRYNLY